MNNNRQIKFRAYLKNSKKIIDWEEIRHNLPLCFYQYDKEKLILMQFTGLTDKNGSEIYEGDLLRVNIDGDVQENIYEVVDMKELFFEFNREDNYYRFNEVEIIGNIFQNPKLIN